MEAFVTDSVQSPVMTTKSNAINQPIPSADVRKHQNVSLK
jgi:hypothetical protein